MTNDSTGNNHLSQLVFLTEEKFASFMKNQNRYANRIFCK